MVSGSRPEASGWPASCRYSLAARRSTCRPGQLPFLLAAAPDALLHRAPDRQQAGAHFGLRPPCQLVAQHHPADRQPVALAQRQQLPGARERQGQRRVALGEHDMAFVVGGGHEAAAHGVVDALVDDVGVRQRDEPHAVGVAGQASRPLEDEILCRVEPDRVHAQQAQPAAPDDGGDARRQAVDVGLFGGLPFQPQHQRVVAAVPAPGRRERAVQMDPDAGCPLQVSGCLQRERELPRRAHGTDRVGARRPDADSEQVEDADRHRRTSSSQ